MQKMFPPKILFSSRQVIILATCYAIFANVKIKYRNKNNISNNLNYVAAGGT